MALKKKFILLICSLILVHLVLYNGFYFFANKKNELILRSDSLQNTRTQYPVLLFGDSHIERSIDSKKLGNRFCSMAYYGENNVMNYYRMKYYFETAKIKPAYIILPSDMVTFAKGYNLYRSNSFFYYSFIPLKELRYFENDLFTSYYNFFKIKLFPYSEWQYGLNLANPNRETKGREKFSLRTEEEKNNNARNFIQNELMCRENKTNLFSKTALTYLEKTIDLCKNQGVKLIFIKLPLTDNLFDEIKFHVDSSYLYDRPSEKLIRAHSLPILDLERVFRNKPELFFDCHHLNIYGRDLFTPILKQHLDSLLKVY